jgi:hypothetical protein
LTSTILRIRQKKTTKTYHFIVIKIVIIKNKAKKI